MLRFRVLLLSLAGILAASAAGPWKMPSSNRPWEMKLYHDLLLNMLGISVTVFHDPAGIERFTVGELLNRTYPEYLHTHQEGFTAPFPAYKCDYIAYMSHDTKRGAESELDRYKRSYMLRQRYHCFFSIWDPELVTHQIDPDTRKHWHKRGSPNNPAILVERYRAGLLLITLLQTKVITAHTPSHEPIIFYSDGDTMFTNNNKDISTLYHRVQRASAQKSLEERVCTPPGSLDLDVVEDEDGKPAFGQGVANYALGYHDYDPEYGPLRPKNRPFFRVWDGRAYEPRRANHSSAADHAATGETFIDIDDHELGPFEEAFHMLWDAEHANDQQKSGSDTNGDGDEDVDAEADDEAAEAKQRRLSASKRGGKQRKPVRVEETDSEHERLQQYLQSDAINPFHSRRMGNVMDEGGKGVWPCARPNSGLLPPVSTGIPDELAYTISASPSCHRGYYTHSGAIIFRATRLTAFVFDILTASPFYKIDTYKFKMGDQAVWDWIHTTMFGMDFSRLARLCSYRFRGLTRVGCAYDEAFFKLILTVPNSLLKHLEHMRPPRQLPSQAELLSGTKTTTTVTLDRPDGAMLRNGTRNLAAVDEEEEEAKEESDDNKYYTVDGPLNTRRQFGRAQVDRHKRRLLGDPEEDEGTMLLLEAYSTWFQEGYSQGEPHKAALVCSKWFNAPSCPKYLKSDPQHSWSCGDFLWHSFGCSKEAWKKDPLSKAVLEPSARCHGVHPVLNESAWFEKP